MQCLWTHLERVGINLVDMKKNSIEERVSLRKLTRRDVDQFFTWASDSEVAKSMTWEAYSSIEEAETFLREIAERHPWFQAICLDGVPVGSITLMQGQGASACRAEIGYVLARTHWGRGIATAAVKQALERGFTELKVQRIEALVDPANAASQRVLIKSGMLCEGFLKNYTLFKGDLRDSYIYAATRLYTQTP